MSLEEILDYIENSKSVEVRLEGDKMVIDEYKGIAKTDVKDIKSLLRGKKVKLDKKRKQIFAELIPALLENKIPFKIILERDPLLKFDMDRYLVFAQDQVKIFGFKKQEEHPLNLVWNLLKDKNCVFYKPVK